MAHNSYAYITLHLVVHNITRMSSSASWVRYMRNLKHVFDKSIYDRQRWLFLPFIPLHLGEKKLWQLITSQQQIQKSDGSCWTKVGFQAIIWIMLREAGNVINHKFWYYQPGRDGKYAQEAMDSSPHRWLGPKTSKWQKRIPTQTCLAKSKVFPLPSCFCQSSTAFI